VEGGDCGVDDQEFMIVSSIAWCPDLELEFVGGLRCGRCDGFCGSLEREKKLEHLS
jgi:hypothetical protein